MKRFIITLLLAVVVTTNTHATEYVVEESGLGRLFTAVGSVIDGACRVVAFPFIWVGEGMKKVVPVRKRRVVIPDTVVVERQPTVVVDYPPPSLNNPVLTPETAPYYYQYMQYYNRQTPVVVPVPAPYYRPYGRPYRPYYGRPHSHHHHHPHHREGGRR